MSDPVNRVMLNLAATGDSEPPDPNMAPVLIDGVPIQSMTMIQIIAGAGIETTVNLSFHAEISGNIGGKSVADMLDSRRKAE